VIGVIDRGVFLAADAAEVAFALTEYASQHKTADRYWLCAGWFLFLKRTTGHA
jgi:hypothetical protein